MNHQDKPVILIADDSRLVRASLKNILNNDCQLIEAEDGQQAWEQLIDVPDIRLIFSDLSMPLLDGRGLLRKVRNSEITRIRNIPFIVLTGNEKESRIFEELQSMGATEVVSKPFDPARIVSFVSTLTSLQENESYMLLPEEEAQTEHLPEALSQNDFLQCASKELSFAIRNKNELAIALLRIDQFEQLKSHYSEPAIEHILRTLAEITRHHIHPDDILAYFGNGVFALLRPASNAIGTRYIGRRIVEDLEAKQFCLGESGDVISVSVGISAPRIKPGIRLRELLLLAEGRLKTAMDLGGNRVIDKGNDTLIPMNNSLATEAENHSYLHSESITPPHPRLDSNSVRLQINNANDPQMLQGKIEQLESRVESLAYENKELQGQIGSWRKRSGESEQLRRRVFELESEQQQLQLKLNELSDNNRALQKRLGEAESERQTLLNSEGEKNLTQIQANQFYEQENIRLEGQLDSLSKRAQNAELAHRKSEQLVISLKDNIKLLRAQMEQIQNQLIEAQQQASQPAPPPSEPPLDIDTDVIVSDTVNEDTRIESRSDSDLVFNGFPSSKLLKAENNPAPAARLFAEPISPATAQIPVRKPAMPSKPVESKTPNLAIPDYRPEPRKNIFREPHSLSSFTIAIWILLLLLSLGSGYLYYHWHKGEESVNTEATTGKSDTAAIPETKPSLGNPSQLEQAAPEPASERQTQTPPHPKQTPKLEKRPVVSATTQTAPSGPRSTTTADEEARLQAELTLRQIAEEEFRQRLHQVPEGVRQTAGDDAFGDSEGIPITNQPAVETAKDQIVKPEDPASGNLATPTPVEPANQ